MALVNPIIGTPSGKVAGTCFAHSRFGSIARRFSNPVGLGPGRNSAQKSNYANLVQAWAALDPMTQANWRLYAASHSQPGRFGAAVFLTGQQWYMRCNLVLIWRAKSLLPSPPGRELTAAITAAQLQIIMGGLQQGVWLNWAIGSTIVTQVDIEWRVTPRVSRGRLNWFARARPLFECDTSVPQPVNVTVQYAALFGAPVSGENHVAYCRLVDVITGLVGPWFAAATVYA
jgi:hypothetical protein